MTASILHSKISFTAKALTVKSRYGLIPPEENDDMECVCFLAVTCPGIEAQLSEHVTWRRVSGSLNEYGAQVVLSCNPGYYLEGRRLVQCQANGTWSVGDERPRCRGEYQASFPDYSAILNC